MSLRLEIEADLAETMEDEDCGFAWPITLIDPGQNTSSGLYGLSTDISQAIDPDTGLLMTGRSASVSLRMSTLKSQGFSIPRGIADETLKPWVVKFNDILGTECTFKIFKTEPDYAMGLVVCFLENYDDGA